VIFDVGYNDTKTFRDTFKKLTGVTPQDYQKKYARNVVHRKLHFDYRFVHSFRVGQPEKGFPTRPGQNLIVIFDKWTYIYLLNRIIVVYKSTFLFVISLFKRWLYSTFNHILISK
jgi:hypothetical protein